MAYRKLELEFGNFTWDDNYFVGALKFNEAASIRHSVPVNGVVLNFDGNDKLVGMEFTNKECLPDALLEMVENREGEIVSMSRKEEESYGKNVD